MIRHETVRLEKLEDAGMRDFDMALQKLCAAHRVRLEASDNGLYVEVTLSEDHGCYCLRNADQ